MKAKSKTLGRGSIYPPLVPCWGVWFCVYVRGLIWQGSVWFCMRLHFFIKASFIIDNEGLVLCHERQYFFFLLVVLFQERCFPSVSFTSNSNFYFKIMWPASVHQPLFEIWNTSSEEFVRRILKAKSIGQIHFNIRWAVRGENVYSYFEKGCRKKCARDNPERKHGIWSIHCSTSGGNF